MNKVKSNQKPKGQKSGKSKTVQEPTKSKLSEIKQDKIDDETGVLVEAAKKIESGAKVLGKRASKVAEKVSEQTTEIAEVTFGKLKKGVSDAYDLSSKTVSDMSKKAGKYVKKYEDTIEMKKLSHDRNKKMQALGEHIFTLYKSKSKDVDELFTNKVSLKILNELEVLNKEIVRIGRKIKRKI
jgi:hypothetical protein